jgi:hypothetical protein
MSSLILIIVGVLLIMTPDYIKYTDNEIAMKIYRNNKVIGLSCMIMGYFIYTDINEIDINGIDINEIDINGIDINEIDRIYMISDNMISDNMISDNMISDNMISDDYFSSS